MLEQSGQSGTTKSGRHPPVRSERSLKRSHLRAALNDIGDHQCEPLGRVLETKESPCKYLRQDMLAVWREQKEHL